eukprot:CAMPEP_0195530438 /NCGR_PEP_ID=MMETSP0794_2-20130614/33324_1 /TAXON_ID=515487 /ORGANISM="Stephanopyxis turris, Strain CCMP 815" /LENGTH=341 /DNA_ID=CAMNT_0040661953 /DNA_START=47 /DNA_END=1068 /DNA_ORIENTATION=-
MSVCGIAIACILIQGANCYVPVSRSTFTNPFVQRTTNNNRSKSSLSKSILTAANLSQQEDDTTVDVQPMLFNGPTLPLELEPVAGATLSELGLDICIAPSTIAPSQLGLYIRVAENTESVTLPEMTLLCGYSREGTFESSPKNSGDKTVGFIIPSSQTAVFYERQLMSVMDALEYAAVTNGNGSCGLFGHEMYQQQQQDSGDDYDVDIVVQDDTDIERYYVPEMVNRVLSEEEVKAEDAFSIQNFGQYSNDLAFDVNDPPTNENDYASRSAQNNILQLVWRMEYKPDEGGGINCLVPSWPVTVLSQDVMFVNTEEFMEVGDTLWVEILGSTESALAATADL